MKRKFFSAFQFNKNIFFLPAFCLNLPLIRLLRKKNQKTRDFCRLRRNTLQGRSVLPSRHVFPGAVLEHQFIFHWVTTSFLVVNIFNRILILGEMSENELLSLPQSLDTKRSLI